MYDHIGLRVGNLDASIRFYTAALAPLGYVLCSQDDSGAGPRADYSPTYYAAFLVDPDGNNVEAVCT